jgi:hypothetical protein
MTSSGLEHRDLLACSIAPQPSTLPRASCDVYKQFKSAEWNFQRRQARRKRNNNSTSCSLSILFLAQTKHPLPGCVPWRKKYLFAEKEFPNGSVVSDHRPLHISWPSFSSFTVTEHWGALLDRPFVFNIGLNATIMTDTCSRAPSGKSGRVPRVIHDHFLPYPFIFIIHR